jgi:hypothetical protein
MSTQTEYLSHQKKKRVVLLTYDEAKNEHDSLQAMEDEIASFKRFDCYEEISADMVSANANTISTHWVISETMSDDGTWRSKERVVARGYEDKEKDRVSSDSPVVLRKKPGLAKPKKPGVRFGFFKNPRLNQ